MRKIEKEEVQTYLTGITRDIVSRKITRNIPVRERGQKVRVSPEK